MSSMHPLSTGPQPDSPRLWSVSSLVLALGDALQSRFGLLGVQGEISGFTRAASGHCYFSLKDEQGSALLRCAMFKRSAMGLNFTPIDGQRVELRARVSVYEPRGELQLVVEAMRRAGQGVLMEQFLRLKAQLEAEGLFRADRKRAWPGWIKRLGLVTSLEAAALHDVLASVRRRAPHVEVVIYPALVQGPQAPVSLVAALQSAAARTEVDALLLCRGGGSLEDLWAFNDPRVVRALVACPMPVASGIGHDTDVSLCDFAADLHAPTPTAAAEMAVRAQEDLQAALADRAQALRRRVAQGLEGAAQRLDRLALRLVRPAQALSRQRQAWAVLERRLHAALAGAHVRRAHALQARHERLARAVGQQLGLRRQALQLQGSRLEALNPRRVLERGFAWLSQEDGQALSRVGQLQTGQAVWAELADGRANLLVQGLAPANAALKPAGQPLPTQGD
jgi:exodeoxyribonuclease VII large subunit